MAIDIIQNCTAVWAINFIHFLFRHYGLNEQGNCLMAIAFFCCGKTAFRSVLEVSYRQNKMQKPALASGFSIMGGKL